MLAGKSVCHVGVSLNFNSWMTCHRLFFAVASTVLSLTGFWCGSSPITSSGLLCTNYEYKDIRVRLECGCTDTLWGRMNAPYKIQTSVHSFEEFWGKMALMDARFVSAVTQLAQPFHQTQRLKKNPPNIKWCSWELKFHIHFVASAQTIYQRNWLL